MSGVCLFGFFRSLCSHFTFGWNFNMSALISFRVHCQMLLKSVSAVFQAAVEAEEQLIEPYLEVNQSRFDPDAIPARKRYLNRRVKLVQTLVRWRKHSGEGSGVESLIKRTVDVFIVPVADGGWDVGGEECLRKVRLLLCCDPKRRLEGNPSPSQVAGILPPELVTPSLRSRLGR